jgi:putative phosphoesterase
VTTHGDIDTAKKVIEKHTDVDMVLHLGDYFRDAQKLSDLFPNIPIEYIYGNSDFMIGDVPAEKVFNFDAKKIMMTHGHRYSVKWGYDKLHNKASEEDVDLLLFGHTHIATSLCKDNKCILNPGSITDPRDGQNESYAIIEIKNGKLDSKIYFMD